jgi:hypothetical protein
MKFKLKCYTTMNRRRKRSAGERSELGQRRHCTRAMSLQILTHQPPSIKVNGVQSTSVGWSLLQRTLGENQTNKRSTKKIRNTNLFPIIAMII